MRAWPGLRGGLGRPGPGLIPAAPALAARRCRARRADGRSRRARLLVFCLPAVIGEDPKGLLLLLPPFFLFSSGLGSKFPSQCSPDLPLPVTQGGCISCLHGDEVVTRDDILFASRLILLTFKALFPSPSCYCKKLLVWCFLSPGNSLVVLVCLVF